jgi:GAF domain-containing protein/anti-sigma regulatory factor (Ser/Thr protein kinase)
MRTRRRPSGRPVSFSAALLLGSGLQVAVTAAFSGVSEGAYRGTPSGLGLLISVTVGVLGGPLAGMLVALVGGIGFIFFVTEAEVGGWAAVVLWIGAAGVAGAVADRYRQVGQDRDIAHASERRARQAAESESTRLAHLHDLTGRLANAITVRDVCEALVDTAIGSLGAAASAVALLSPDETQLGVEVSRGFSEELLGAWSRIPVDAPVIVGDAVGQRSVVTVGSAKEALERYPMLAELGDGYPIGAQAAAPLLAGDSLLGVVSVSFRESRRFSVEDEMLLLAIGRQCGQAIERARLFEAERQARQRATRLRELASALAGAASPSEVANIGVNAVGSILGSRRVSVGALTPDGRMVEPIAAEGQPSVGQAEGSSIPLDAPSPTADAVSGGRSVLLGSPEDIRHEYPGLADALARDRDRACACVPLKASGVCIGTLFVTYAEPQAFDERQRAELQTVADQVALALERSLLQESREESIRLTSRLARVRAVGEAMTPDLGVEEVATAILVEAAEGLGSVAGGIAVATRDGNRLEFISRFGVRDDVPQSVSLEAANPLTEAYRSGAAALIEGPQDLRGSPPPGPSLLGEPVEALLATPVSGRGRRIGVIGLRFDHKHSFSPDELRFVEALAQEAGEALERARMFEAEQRALKRAARLQEVTARLARAVTTEDAARAILRGATGGVGADSAAIALASDDGASLRLVPGTMARGTLRLQSPIEISVSDRSALAHVYRNGRALWMPSQDVWKSRFEDGWATQRDLGVCLYAVPIVAKGEAIGAMAVYFKQEREAPSAEDSELIRSFAHQAGVALERARAYEVEHEAAMTLQRNLMPEGVARAATVDADGRYLPATRGVHVGGDWYDILDRPDGTVAFAVGDIAGHGLQAAAAMGQVRSAWRALALSTTEPSAILASLERFANGVEGAFFSTVLTMLLDPATNELRYATAGHPPALVIEPDGSTRFLEGGRSVPLGLPFDLPRAQAHERLTPGSILVLYTDGLVERRDESLDRGLERLAETAARATGERLEDLSEALLDLVADERHDDVALLVIGSRRLSGEFRRSFPASANELSALRADLRAWLERSGVAMDTVDDVVLACTEAASNAIEHAYIGRIGDVHVVAQRQNGVLELSVSDDGRWRHPRPDDARGRGLDLVRALVGHVDVEQAETGTTVRMRVGDP